MPCVFHTSQVSSSWNPMYFICFPNISQRFPEKKIPWQPGPSPSYHSVTRSTGRFGCVATGGTCSCKAKAKEVQEIKAPKRTWWAPITRATDGFYWGLYHVISCYIMLYHVISCYIMLYHVISCYIMLYHVISNCIELVHGCSWGFLEAISNWGIAPCGTKCDEWWVLVQKYGSDSMADTMMSHQTCAGCATFRLSTRWV